MNISIEYRILDITASSTKWYAIDKKIYQNNQCIDQYKKKEFMFWIEPNRSNVRSRSRNIGLSYWWYIDGSALFVDVA